MTLSTIVASKGITVALSGVSSSQITDATTPGKALLTAASAAAQLTAIGAAPANFTQTGTGAVARTLQSKVGDRLSVLDFGAKMTVGTDDAIAFNATRTAAIAGTTISVPPGPLNISYSPVGGPAVSLLWQLGGNNYGSTSVPVSGLGQGYDVVETFLGSGGTKAYFRPSATMATSAAAAGPVLRIDSTQDYVGVLFTGSLTAGSATVTSVTNIAQLSVGQQLNGSGTVFSTIAAINVSAATITLSAPAPNTVANATLTAGGGGVAPVIQINATLPALPLNNFVWANQTIMTTSAYGEGQHVAASASVFRPASALADGHGPRAQTWSSYLENNDRTGQGASVAGSMVGMENDIYANGPDASGYRVIMALVAGQSATSFAFVANTISGQTTLTNVSNAYNLTVGQVISGPGIPAGTTITFIAPTISQLAMSNNATITATLASLTQVASPMQCGKAISIGANASTSFGNFMQANVPFYQTALDFSGSTSLNGLPLLSMASGQKIAFEPTNQRVLSYTAGAFAYSINNNATTTLSISDSGTVTLNAGTLATAAGSTLSMLNLVTADGNGDGLFVTNRRVTAGTGWANANLRIQRVVEGTQMGFVEFGDGASTNYSVRIGNPVALVAQFLDTGTTIYSPLTASAALTVAGYTTISNTIATQGAAGGLSISDRSSTGAVLVSRSAGITSFYDNAAGTSLLSLNGTTSTVTVPSLAIGGKAGFNGTAPVTKPTVSGAKGSNAALASLITALAAYGLIVDSSTT